jgi:hypothetical protein
MEFIRINVDMYIDRTQWPSKNGQTYTSVWLRESYRDPADGKVKKRAILNLKNVPADVVDALELALKHKSNLAELCSLDELQVQHQRSVGAVWTAYQVAQRLGLLKALGQDQQGKLALWQIIARLLDQGSRLSAVRLAEGHAAAEILQFERGFSENELYDNLGWIHERQNAIEKTLFSLRQDACPTRLFLYDVTSSYLEGQCNELGRFGYNRDGKRGKLQIVIGLLCDQQGEPLAVEVFEGNTLDPKTVASQIKKAAGAFGCQAVTFVGDRGMLKSAQLEGLEEAGFDYITAITKPQIRTLLSRGVLQLDMFDERLLDVAEEGGARYVLRRNPARAAELAASRQSKRARIERALAERNDYLEAHAHAGVGVARKHVQGWIGRLGVGGWIALAGPGRENANDKDNDNDNGTGKDGNNDRKNMLSLVIDEAALREEARLDGCYALKTSLGRERADTQSVHARYKDLAHVERAFRTSKTGHLELRPIFVRTEEHTRGHVLVVMLAYKIRRYLERAWAGLDLTVEEGLDQLKLLGAVQVKLEGKVDLIRIMRPNAQQQRLLDAIGVTMPEFLPKPEVVVDTHKKLGERRKNAEK